MASRSWSDVSFGGMRWFRKTCSRLLTLSSLNFSDSLKTPLVSSRTFSRKAFPASPRKSFESSSPTIGSSGKCSRKYVLTTAWAEKSATIYPFNVRISSSAESEVNCAILLTSYWWFVVLGDSFAGDKVLEDWLAHLACLKDCLNGDFSFGCEYYMTI